VREPGIWSNAWRCERDGDVDPVSAPVLPSHEQLAAVMAHARVPFWLPWPLPTGWLATGLSWAGDDRTGARAALLACGGPSPLGGYSELLVIAEEPGVGLGAHWAGLPGLDPGRQLAASGNAHAKVQAGGHTTPLWCVDGAGDSAVFVGEARGLWLWLVLWPGSSGALVHDSLALVDLRDAPRDLQPPLGALSTRLRTS
jgi:hypothetical protein